MVMLSWARGSYFGCSLVGGVSSQRLDVVVGRRGSTTAKPSHAANRSDSLQTGMGNTAEQLTESKVTILSIDRQWTRAKPPRSDIQSYDELETHTITKAISIELVAHRDLPVPPRRSLPGRRWTQEGKPLNGRVRGGARTHQKFRLRRLRR